jgi:hypothetical protein
MTILQTITLASDSPFSNPQPWDALVLGSGPTFTWLGPVDFRGAKRSFSWQYKYPKGIKGDVNTFRGTHCQSFMMRVHVWSASQWGQLPQLLSYFNYDGTKLGPDGTPLANPVNMFHPALALIGITQVICEEIHAFEIDKEHSGRGWQDFKLHEFLPEVSAINATKTPLAATPFLVSETAGVAAAIATQSQETLNLAQQLGTPGSLP